MDIHVIGSKDILLGFELIGVNGIEVENKNLDHVKEKLLKFSEAKENVFIIIEQAIADSLGEFLIEFELDNLHLFIITIPGIDEEFPEFNSTEFLKNLIK